MYIVIAIVIAIAISRISVMSNIFRYKGLVGMVGSTFCQFKLFNLKQNESTKMRHTWRRAIEAYKPVNLGRGNRDVSSTNTSSVDVVYSWLKPVTIGVYSKPAKSTMPDIFGIGKAHPLGHRRPYPITGDDNLSQLSCIYTLTKQKQ